MRTYFRLGLLITLIGLALTSCSNNENQVSEVKLIPVKNGTDYQYIDRDGKVIIKAEFSEATIFRDGLALVKPSGEKKWIYVNGFQTQIEAPSHDQKWGFISKDGNFLIPANYIDATFFNEGIAWVVSENSAPMAINKKGEVIFTLKEAQKVKVFEEGLAAYSVIDRSDNKWGFVTKEGNVKISPQFIETKSFSDGKCAVKNKHGKWGYIDKDGKTIIDFQFDEAENFKNGKAVVYTENGAGLIDENGNYLINPQFSELFIDNDDMLLFKQDKRYGWCDKNGKVLINPQFLNAFPFLGNDLAAVEFPETYKYGYINKKGKIIINPQFGFATPFNGNLALISNTAKYNNTGFIDQEGKYVINPQFQDGSDDFLNFILNYSNYYNCSDCFHFTSSDYKSVQTDYFDATEILKTLNLPNGPALNVPISTLLAKYQKTPNDLLQENIFNSESIKGFIIDEGVIAEDAFTNSADNESLVFNPDSKVTGFVYSIHNHTKIENKNIIKTIEKSLENAYFKSLESDGNIDVYENIGETIQVYDYNGIITVKFLVKSN